MSETPPPDKGTETTPTETTSGSVTITTTETVDTAAEIQKWKDMARKHEDRAKANAKAAQELETLRQQSMTDQEKAISEAKAAARAEVLSEVGAKVAAAEFKAAAAGRLGDDQLSTLLAGLDLKAFLDEAGEVDGTKVQTFVDSIAPAVTEQPEEEAGDLLAHLDFGQGARGTTTNVAGLGSTQLERDLRKSLGM